jgi:hypothetical protein
MRSRSRPHQRLAGGCRASARGTPPLPGRARHFVHVDDLTRGELDAVLRRAGELKAAFRAGDTSYQPLLGKSLAMIFAKPSLRTRVSFEVVRRARSTLRAGTRRVTPRRRPSRSRSELLPRAARAGVHVPGRPRAIPRS